MRRSGRNQTIWHFQAVTRNNPMSAYRWVLVGGVGTVTRICVLPSDRFIAPETIACAGSRLGVRNGTTTYRREAVRLAAPARWAVPVTDRHHRAGLSRRAAVAYLIPASLSGVTAAGSLARLSTPQSGPARRPRLMFALRMPPSAPRGDGRPLATGPPRRPGADCRARAMREEHHGRQGDHQLCGNRRDPHAQHVGPSADHAGGDRTIVDRGGGSRRGDHPSAPTERGEPTPDPAVFMRFLPVIKRSVVRW